jgi:hypothetical protein
MAEYCSKMNEHISKIAERYIKMAYSKHKMTEYHGDGGLVSIFDLYCISKEGYLDITNIMFH